MSSDEKDETYWLGVRDALRMVDSFVRWSARHEDKAKNLQEFISEGLIAAAKRCESCLSTTLGLTFGESLDGRSPDDLLEPADPTDRLPTHYEEPTEEKDDTVPDDEVPVTEELISAPKFEPEPAESSVVEPTSIDAIERTEDTEIEDMQVKGPSRDFGAEFELGEPSSLTIEPEVEDHESFASESSKLEASSEPEDVDVIEEEVESPDEIDKEVPEVEPPPPPPPPESDESEEERRRRARRLFFGT
ncbi:MAG: hypothetical protein KAJ96_00215 [Candidatus Thorarchaeota archaeon]|nr:hypothetical protein [Candidatus Thorarchaeota archaeon]